MVTIENPLNSMCICRAFRGLSWISKLSLIVACFGSCFEVLEDHPCMMYFL